ncbi:hypothetical protein D3C86_1966340 [compost metagenome]
MIEGIFHNGLQNQLNRLELEYFVLRFNLKAEFIFETETLDNQVMADMIQFFLYSNDIIPLAQTDPEKLGE